VALAWPRKPPIPLFHFLAQSSALVPVQAESPLRQKKDQSNPAVCDSQAAAPRRGTLCLSFSFLLGSWSYCFEPCSTAAAGASYQEGTWQRSIGLEQVVVLLPMAALLLEVDSRAPVHGGVGAAARSGRHSAVGTRTQKQGKARQPWASIQYTAKTGPL
jgi:hypothetical protein